MMLLASLATVEIESLNIDGFDIDNENHKLALTKCGGAHVDALCASLGCKVNDCTAQQCANNTCGNNYCVGQSCNVQNVCDENTCIGVTCNLNFSNCGILVGGCPSNAKGDGDGDGGGDGGDGDGDGDGTGDGVGGCAEPKAPVKA